MSAVLSRRGFLLPWVARDELASAAARKRPPGAAPAQPEAPWEARRRASAMAMSSANLVARLLRFECIAAQTPCSTCVERCPVDGALTLRSGPPALDPALCTGCGACAEACPAPRPALVMMPRLAAAPGATQGAMR